MTIRVVAGFQGNSPGGRLRIGDSRFRFDSTSPASARHQSVPSSQITFTSQRDLRPPAKAWCNSRTQSFEKSELRGVPERIPPRVGAEHEIEAEDCAISAKELQVRVTNLAPLESADARMRAPDGGSHLGLAEARPDSGVATVGAHGGDLGSASPATPVDWTFPRRHRSPWSQSAIHSPLRAVVRTLGVRTDEWGIGLGSSVDIPPRHGTLRERNDCGSIRCWPVEASRPLAGTLGVQRATGWPATRPLERGGQAS